MWEAAMYGGKPYPVINPVGKIAEKAVCWSVCFDNTALSFECQINKKHSFRVFGDFTHWE